MPKNDAVELVVLNHLQVFYALFKALVILITALRHIPLTHSLHDIVLIVVALHNGVVHVAHHARRISGVGDVENPYIVGSVYHKGVVRHVVYKWERLHLEALQVQQFWQWLTTFVIIANIFVAITLNPQIDKIVQTFYVVCVAFIGGCI